MSKETLTQIEAEFARYKGLKIEGPIRTAAQAADSDPGNQTWTVSRDAVIGWCLDRKIEVCLFPGGIVELKEDEFKGESGQGDDPKAAWFAYHAKEFEMFAKRTESDQYWRNQVDGTLSQQPCEICGSPYDYSKPLAEYNAKHAAWKQEQAKEQADVLDILRGAHNEYYYDMGVQDAELEWSIVDYARWSAASVIDLKDKVRELRERIDRRDYAIKRHQGTIDRLTAENKRLRERVADDE